MKFEWETIYSQGRIDVSQDGGSVLRAKVYGGWIVNNYWWDSDYKTYSESMVFIPDPNHKWVIDD